MFINCSEELISEKEEKIILINIVGVLEALKKRKLTIIEAEKFLFSPNIISRLKKIHICTSIIEILEKGCELEDIESLLPESLNNSIEELQTEALEILGRYPCFEKKFWV